MHLKGTNVSVSLQMVTMLVTAVIPGIKSTKQDNNSSKQLSFVRAVSSLAGGGRALAPGTAGPGTATRLLATRCTAGHAWQGLGWPEDPKISCGTHGDLGKLPDRM